MAGGSYLLKDKNGDDVVFLAGSSGRLALVLLTEAGVPLQSSQVTAIKLWLSLRDDPTLPVGGINGVSNVEILNADRGTLGAGKAVTGGSLTTDYTVRLTIAAHGYATGDLVSIRDVVGLTGANGDWLVTVVDTNTIALQGSLGSGAWSSGGTATKALHVTLKPADNAIIDSTIPSGEEEWHQAYLLVSYGVAGVSSLPIVVQYQVLNIGP